MHNYEYSAYIWVLEIDTFVRGWERRVQVVFCEADGFRSLARPLKFKKVLLSMFETTTWHKFHACSQFDGPESHSRPEDVFF